MLPWEQQQGYSEERGSKGVKEREGDKERPGLLQQPSVTPTYPGTENNRPLEGNVRVLPWERQQNKAGLQVIDTSHNIRCACPFSLLHSSLFTVDHTAVLIAHSFSLASIIQGFHSVAFEDQISSCEPAASTVTCSCPRAAVSDSTTTQRAWLTGLPVLPIAGEDSHCGYLAANNGIPLFFYSTILPPGTKWTFQNQVEAKGNRCFGVFLCALTACLWLCGRMFQTRGEWKEQLQQWLDFMLISQYTWSQQRCWHFLEEGDEMCFCKPENFQVEDFSETA